MTPKLTALVAVTFTVALAAPGAALAASPTADCNAHGRLTQRYSESQLQNALADMPADVQEYTNCYNVVHQALLAQISGLPNHRSTSSSVSSGSFLPTPVIVALVVLALGGATAGAVAVRRRGQP